MGIFRKLIPVLLAAVTAIPSLAEKKKDDISNMIIQGENRLRVEPRVPPVEWAPPPYRDVNGAIEDYALLGELTPPTIQDPPVVLPVKSVSGKTATPWLERIYEPPILKVKLMPSEAAAKNNAEWAFIIKGSDGGVFYEMKGKSQVPPAFVWDGFGNRGDPLRVGFDYAFSLSAVDQGGNPQRRTGKPFRVDAFRYKKAMSVVTAFQPEAIFADKSSIKISEDGTDYLTEVKDSLRRAYGHEVVVLVFEEDAKFADVRARAVRDWLIKALDIPQALIQARGLTVSKGGGYRHVDIVAK